MERSLKHIAHIRSDFPEKFGIPRQARLADTEAVIVFEPEYRKPDALRGLDGFSHIWIIWEFSENINEKDWPVTVRPPRLGGNVRMGVFATRSPNRPNPIGMSVVKLLGIEHDAELGDVIRVGGADLMDGTPIFDIKPYIVYSDSIPDAVSGFASSNAMGTLQVAFPPELLQKVPENKRKGLTDVLAQDPRPRYQDDPEREYGIAFAKQNIKFTVRDKVLTVTEVEER